MPNENIFQIISSKIFYFLKSIYDFLISIVDYFSHYFSPYLKILQNPFISAFVCILSIIILRKMYNSLAKKNYKEPHSIFFTHCMSWWVFLLIIFIIIHTVSGYYYNVFK